MIWLKTMRGRLVHHICEHGEHGEHGEQLLHAQSRGWLNTDTRCRWTWLEARCRVCGMIYRTEPEYERY